MILFPASTMAAADFAAVMALASRVYRTWEPAFAAEAEDAAVRAWDWLMQHPQFIGFEIQQAAIPAAMRIPRIWMSGSGRQRNCM